MAHPGSDPADVGGPQRKGFSSNSQPGSTDAGSVKTDGDSQMLRSTKIVATLGPASSDVRILQRMLAAGVDVVRFNFSHGKPEDHLARAKLDYEVSILQKRPSSPGAEGSQESPGWDPADTRRRKPGRPCP